MLFHVSNGAVWFLLLIVTRFFIENKLQVVIGAQASFVFFCFLCSLGLGTAVRVFYYEGAYEKVKLIIMLSVSMPFLLLFLAVVDTHKWGEVFSVTLYNVFFIRAALGVASKRYYSVIYCSFTCLLITIFYFTWAVEWVGDDVFLLGLLVMFLAMLVFRYDINARFSFYSLYDVLARSVLLVVSVFPIRILVFSFGVFFSSVAQDPVFSKLYADLLVVFGVYSFFMGRYFLYNEKEIIDGRVNVKVFLCMIFPLFFSYVYFSFYGLLTMPLNEVFSLFIVLPLFFVSREPFSMLVNFSNQAIRIRVVTVAYIVSVGIYIFLIAGYMSYMAYFIPSILVLVFMLVVFYFFFKVFLYGFNQSDKSGCEANNNF